MDKFQIALVVSLLAGAAAADVVFPPTFELSSLLAANGGDGTLGFVLQGGLESGRIGDWGGAIGDVNADGLDDLVVSAIHADAAGRFRAGTIYVLFGRADGFPAEILATDLNGTNGFRIIGANENDQIGAVSSAGDLNADGISDILIGAGRAFDFQGAAYVIFGTADGFPQEIDLASLDGVNGFRLFVNDASWFGAGVALAGDVNADGIDDIIIGEVLASPDGREEAGKSYVIFGSEAGFPPVFDAALLDGTNGFVLHGVLSGDLSGFSVSGPGDVNADGIDDVAIIASGADLLGRSGSGVCYIVFGTDSGFSPQVELSGLDGTNGFVIVGPSEESQLWSLIRHPGDFNGDGVSDILLGAAPFALSPFAACLFGSESGFPPLVDLAELDGDSGFLVSPIDQRDWFGFAVSSAGDIDADAIDDIIISASRAETGFRIRAGQSYVLFGSRDAWPAVIDVGTLDGDVGFSLSGFRRGSLTGASANYAGDLNGDGIADLVIGSPQASPNELKRAGEAFIVFGRDLVCAADLTGSSDPDDPEYGEPDGQVDADDFFFYLDAFASGDTDICDIDEDADCDAEDFFAYLDLFAAGCS